MVKGQSRKEVGAEDEQRRIYGLDEAKVGRWHLMLSCRKRCEEEEVNR